jgi:hypothetical protein
MNKGIVIKASIILGFFAIVLGLAFGCSSVRDKNVTPQLTNGEDVYLTVGDITITNQELWDMMKISDGVSFLTQYIEEILLADYISGVTAAEIAEAVELATYGTNDQDVINKIKEDAELEADLIETYNQSLVISGFDPDNADSVRAYFQLSIAKEKYTTEFILAAQEGDALEITDEDVQDYYESNTYGDVCALTVRFHSGAEASSVLDKFNLVPNYNEGFGKYFGTTAIEDVLTSEFDDTNTTQLTDEEVFAEFVGLWNYMNPNEAAIATDITFENYCTNHADMANNVYDDNMSELNANSNLTAYTNYIFGVLGLEDEDNRYSYTVQEIADYSFVSFKVSEEDVPAYEDLTAAEVTALKEEMVEDLVTSNSINIAMDELYEGNELEVYDPILKLQYEFNEGTIFDNKGDDSLVATLGDIEITADTLFNYMADSLGTYYSIEMVKAESLLLSDTYTEKYGESYDYLNSNDDEMVAHREELREMKSLFSGDQYAPYGFSSSQYTWEEFLILAFGSYSEADAIKDVFVIGALQPYLVKDLIAYQNAADFIQAQVDEYFSLDATHILLYLDQDFDFTPDEYNDYVDGLSGADLTEYNSLIVDFEDLLLNKVNNDEMTFDEIVEEYQDSLIDDVDNDWAPFKEYGFFIMTEDLSAEGSLTNSNTGNYDEDFVAALDRIYNSYLAAIESSVDDLDRYVDDRIVQSNFGMHFIIATEGDGFEQPTAEYTDTENDYSEGSEGTTVAPNQAQVELFIEINFAETVGETTDLIMPTSVYDAVEAYYGGIYNAYFSTSGYSIATATYLLDNNPQYATDQADRISFLENVVEILYSVTFPDEFNAPE